MARRSTRIYNPANYITWRDNLSLAVQNNMTLIGLVRLLIDQATSTGTLNDYPVAGDIFWPSQQLYDAANEVMLDFWPMLSRQPVPVQLTNTAFVVSSGTDIFAFDSTKIMVPSYLVLNTATMSGAAAQVINQKYWVSDRSKLEQYDNNWRQWGPAQPKWFIIFDAAHLRVFPSPNATYPFTIYGVPWPTELATGTEDITADPTLKLSIAYRAAANILEATRPDIADSYQKESDELLHRYKIRLRNEQTNNMHRMKPAVGGRQQDLTMGAMKGVIKLGRRLS